MDKTSLRIADSKSFSIYKMWDDSAYEFSALSQHFKTSENFSCRIYTIFFRNNILKVCSVDLFCEWCFNVPDLVLSISLSARASTEYNLSTHPSSIIMAGSLLPKFCNSLTAVNNYFKGSQVIWFCLRSYIKSIEFLAIGIILWNMSCDWVAVRRTYVFTLQEVEKICRTLQSNVMQHWTKAMWHSA